MRWLNNMNETIKRGIRTWLNVVPASGNCIQINEVLDFEANAIRNRIWYRGDGNELEQMYQQAPEYADKYKFWGQQVHTGSGDAQDTYRSAWADYPHPLRHCPG